MVLEPPRQQVTLADGRMLAYLVYGPPPNQAAAVAFHLYGTPASAVHDEPCVGGRRLADVLGVTQLAAVRGESGGGPYAAAAAALLGQQRVRQLHLISAMGPVWAPGHAELRLALTWLDATSCSYLHWPWRPCAWLLHRLYKLLAERKPGAIRAHAADDMGPDDQQFLAATPELQDSVVALLRGAYHQGVSGPLKDFEVIGGEWQGIDASAIKCKTFIWQGGTDLCVKPVNSHWYASAIPGSTLRVMEGEGHLTMCWRRCAEILAEMAAAAE